MSYTPEIGGISIFNTTTSSDISEWLINQRDAAIQESEARRPVMLLVKDLQKRHEELESFINTIATGGIQPGKCVTVPRLSLIEIFDGCSECRHVIYAKIWRWPNVVKSQLIPLEYCRYGYGRNAHSVCVNPYHYEHADLVKQMSYPANDFYNREHTLVVDFIPLQKQVELINMSKRKDDILLIEKTTGVNPLHIKCILHREKEILQKFNNRIYDLSIDDMDGADVILLEWIKYYKQNSKYVTSFYTIAKEAKHLSDLLDMPNYYIRHETWLKIKDILKKKEQLVLTYKFKLDMYTILKTCGEFLLKPKTYRKFLDTIERTTFIPIKQFDEGIKNAFKAYEKSALSEINTNKDEEVLINLFIENNLDNANNEVIYKAIKSSGLTIVEEPAVSINVNTEYDENCKLNQNDNHNYKELLNLKDLNPELLIKREEEMETFEEFMYIESELEKLKENKKEQTNGNDANRSKCELESIKIEDNSANLTSSDLPFINKEEEFDYEEDEEFITIQDIEIKNEIEDAIDEQNKNNDDNNEADEKEDDFIIVFEIEDADESLESELQEIINQYKRNNESKEKLKKQANNNDIAAINCFEKSSEVKCKDSFTFKDITVSKQKIAKKHERDRTDLHCSNMCIQPNKVQRLEE